MNSPAERPDTRKLWNANAAAWTELSRADTRIAPHFLIVRARKPGPS